MTTTRTTTDDGARDGAAARDRLVLTIAEAAEVLGISRAFAYELAARGEIPILRLGRRRLVPRKALLAMVGDEPSGGASTPSAPSLIYRLVAEGS
ncbi:MAG: helix-turn-helix domain-containing protein [Acidimicrobiales bacterium]